MVRELPEFGPSFRLPEWHRESPEFFRFFDGPSYLLYLLTLLAQISLLIYFQLTQFTATSRVTSRVISFYCKQLPCSLCVFIIRLIKWRKIQLIIWKSQRKNTLRSLSRRIVQSHAIASHNEWFLSQCRIICFVTKNIVVWIAMTTYIVLFIERFTTR